MYEGAQGDLTSFTTTTLSNASCEDRNSADSTDQVWRKSSYQKASRRIKFVAPYNNFLNILWNIRVGCSRL